jgi:tetratricopeptide (TPR) repeat protein
VNKPFTFIMVMMLALTLASWAMAGNSTVDVISYENGEIKHTKMAEDEANAKYAPVGPAVNLTLDQKEAKEGLDADGYYLEGIKFLQNGESQKALEALLTADKLRPGKPNIYNSLGMAYKNMGDNELALQYFQKALEIKPDSPEYLVNLAFYYYDLGQCDLALPYFEKARSLNSQMDGLSKYIDECSRK